MGRVYAVASAKGGVGKTTTTANLGVALAATEYHVAVVDADLGMPNLGRALGIHPDGPTLHDVLTGEEDPLDAVYERDDGLAVVPGSTDLDAYVKSSPQGLSEVVDALEAAGYDLILIDTGAGLSHETALPLGVADAAILVSTPGPDALGDTEKTRQIAQRLNVPVVGIVLNRVDTATVDVEALTAALSVEVIQVIADDPTVEAAIVAADPIISRAPDGDIASSYRALAEVLTADATTVENTATDNDDAPEPNAVVAAAEAALSSTPAVASEVESTAESDAAEVESTAETEGSDGTAERAVDAERATDARTTSSLEVDKGLDIDLEEGSETIASTDDSGDGASSPDETTDLSDEGTSNPDEPTQTSGKSESDTGGSGLAAMLEDAEATDGTMTASAEERDGSVPVDEAESEDEGGAVDEDAVIGSGENATDPREDDTENVGVTFDEPLDEEADDVSLESSLDTEIPDAEADGDGDTAEEDSELDTAENDGDEEDANDDGAEEAEEADDDGAEEAEEADDETAVETELGTMLSDDGDDDGDASGDGQKKGLFGRFFG